MIMAPGVHPTGPSGNFSVAGAMSFDNLYLVNGVTVNENLRGQAQQNLVIEDAIEETTIATGGVSAEFGRFGGGVINVITKSGGNDFSGSFRLGLANDDWRTLVPKREGDPFANDTQDGQDRADLRVHGRRAHRSRSPVVLHGRASAEAGAEPPAGHHQHPLHLHEQAGALRVQGHLLAINQNHRVQGAYTKVNVEQLNNTFSTAASMDLNSLEDRKLPEDLFTINYTGVLTPSLSIEGRYSQRHLTFEGSGAKFTDPIKGTLLVEQSGRRYWSATFCGVCEPELRDNQDIFVKANYFLSTRGYGAHAFVAGFDNFDDLRQANNHQSGSDYRIVNANAIVQGTNLTPQFINGTTQIQWNPIFVSSEGSKFKTLSFFLNDNWRVTDRVTANVGVRWDKNDGVGSDGVLIADGASFSPRFGIVWDPDGGRRVVGDRQRREVHVGAHHEHRRPDLAGGQLRHYRFVYRGPSINADPNGPLVPTEEAIRQVFAWYKANGGATLPLATTPGVRGVSPRIPNSLESPGAWEYSGGVAVRSAPGRRCAPTPPTASSATST